MLSVPAGAEGMEIRPIETMGGEVVNDVFFTDCHVDADRLLGDGGQALDAAHVRAQRRAADPRRADARHRPARVRRHARLRQGARAVRPADRLLPGAQAPASPTSRPRSSAAACSPTTSRAAVDANPGAMFPREASMAKLKVTETAKQRRARGHADDGRLRLRDRVRHGGPRAPRRSSRRSTAARARSSATSSADVRPVTVAAVLREQGGAFAVEQVEVDEPAPRRGPGAHRRRRASATPTWSRRTGRWGCRSRPCSATRARAWSRPWAKAWTRSHRATTSC